LQKVQTKKHRIPGNRGGRGMRKSAFQIYPIGDAEPRRTRWDTRAGLPELCVFPEKRGAKASPGCSSGGAMGRRSVNTKKREHVPDGEVA